VLLGRPYCYALALRGEQSVREMLRNLLADLELTLGLAGCQSPAEVSRENVMDGQQADGQNHS
jgi:lactate 2-monooxygenase